MGTIEICIRSLAQLFDALDPSPLGVRALDRSVEIYIRARAGKNRSTEPLRLRVHLPEALRATAVEAGDAIHEHLRRVHAHGEWVFRRRLRLGAVFLIAALGVLAGSFWLRSLLNDVHSRVPVQGLAEGLLILGRVSMWRPVDILLFEHWESHLDHAILERLASIPLEFVFHPGTGREPIAESRHELPTANGRCLPDDAQDESRETPPVTEPQVLSALITGAALASYLNHRFLPLPAHHRSHGHRARAIDGADRPD